MTTNRYTEPTPTRGPGPSHSPPDTMYAPTHGVARGLGWFSIALGMAELFAPKAMSAATGVRSEGLIQAYGLREIACGVGILTSKRPDPSWLWARVAGDVLDLATLGVAMGDPDPDRRENALISAAAVAGVTALDVTSAVALTAAARLEG